MLCNKLTLANEYLQGCKEKLVTKAVKIGATGMALSGSTMAMVLTASADDGNTTPANSDLATGLANVSQLLTWVWNAITGNTFLFTIFCMSLASMAFGLMRTAKRSPR
jgi:hypothetical protein